MQIGTLIPWGMVVVRALLGPVIIFGEQRHWKGPALCSIILIALLSDIFDGILARRWKTDTARLRLCDSMADTVFYLGVATALRLGVPAVWQEYWVGLFAVLTLEGVRFAFDFLKFGKPASYHSYIAKTWGLVLATAVVMVFATQAGSAWMSAAILLGILANLESLAMSGMLRSWHCDVKTLAAAWRIRGESQSERVPKARLTTAVTSLLLVFVGTAVGAAVAEAQSLQHVTYVGGTTLTGNGMHGKVRISATDTLTFESAAKITIPYGRIISYESKPHKEVHVGLLTEGVWKLIAPWPEGRNLSLSYIDTAEHPQVIVLQMSRADEALLVEVLKTRVPRGGYRPPPTLQAQPAVVAQMKTADH